MKMTDSKGSCSSNPDVQAIQKEWDDISCAICMEHPHNAVLLICSSHEKGCRSYLCDTSYRHSNCLDRFKKLKLDHGGDHYSQSISFFHDHPDTERNLAENMPGTIETSVRHNSSLSASLELNNLKCPLCRGTVLGWRVIKEVRRYLDLKPRSCSRESCLFSGNYGELRRHARRVHPLTRPADVDPSRQRAWRHLEHEREYGDILSAIRSAMPGSVTLGDYVINDEDLLSHDRELGSDTGSWWATLFLFHVMSSSNGLRDEFGVSPRSWRVRRRPSSANRYLWGENLLGLQDNHNDDEEEILLPRRRRRTTRSRAEEERP